LAVSNKCLKRCWTDYRLTCMRSQSKGQHWSAAEPVNMVVAVSASPVWFGAMAPPAAPARA